MTTIPTLEDGYPRVSLIVTFLFFIYVFNHYVELGTRIEFLREIRFEWVLGLLLAVLGVFTGNIFCLGDNRNIHFVVLLFYFIVAIQVPFSQNYDQSAVIFIDRFVKLSFMALFIVAFVRSPNHVKIFIAGFLLACMKLGQEGLAGKITGSMMWENQGIMRLHGHGAIYGHPNSYSGMALGTIPFLYYFFPLFAWKMRFAMIVQLMLAINIIIFTASRTGYIGFISLLGYIFLKTRYNIRIVLMICGFLIASAYFVPDMYLERFETIYTGMDIEGASIDSRKLILKDAIQIFRSNPLGVGVAAFPSVRQSTFGRSQDTHNIYLEILTNTGVQGGIAFFVLIIVLFRTLGDLEKRYAGLLRKVVLSTESKTQILNDSLSVTKHIADLRFMKATCQAVKLFLILRLIVGFFGSDLYEIYWWFATGLTLTAWNIYPWAERKTSFFFVKDSIRIEEATVKI